MKNTGLPIFEILLNQSGDHLSVRLTPENTGNVELMIFDMVGNKMMQMIFTIGASVDLSAFSKGDYIIFVQKGLEYVVKRFTRN